MSVELRQLEQFLAIADAGSFRGAAEQLHIAQPALSVSIRKLEDTIGARLFERGARGARLTAAGDALLPEARQALRHADQGRRNARLAALGEWGALRLGFVGSATYSLLPRCLPAFRERYPEVRLELVEGTTLGVVDMVRDGRADIGAIRGPVADATGLRVDLAETDSFVAVLPAGHPLAGRRQLRLAALRDEPFVLFSESQVPGLRGTVEQVCREAGFAPRVGQEATQVQTVVSLVASGLGVALVPSVAAAYASERVRFVRLSDTTAVGRLGLWVVTRDEAVPPSARRLREMLLGGVRPAARAVRQEAAPATPR